MQAKLSALGVDDFEPLESPDHLVTMGKIFAGGSSLLTMRASMVCDAEAETCALWEKTKMNR